MSNTMWIITSILFVGFVTVYVSTKGFKKLEDKADRNWNLNRARFPEENDEDEG